MGCKDKSSNLSGSHIGERVYQWLSAKIEYLNLPKEAITHIESSFARKVSMLRERIVSMLRERMRFKTNFNLIQKATAAFLI